METRSRVSPNGTPPRKIPLAREQKQPRRAVEDRTSRGLVNGQAQGISSIHLNEVGKGQWDYDITNKINDALLMPCSPEALAALTPPMPLSPPIFCHLFDEPVFKLPAKWRIYDVVISKNEEQGVSQSLPEDLVAEALSIPLSADQMWEVSPSHLLDEPKQSTREVQRSAYRTFSQDGETSNIQCSPESLVALTLPACSPTFAVRAIAPHQPLHGLLPAGTMHGRHDPHIFNNRCQMSDSCSPEDEAAQKQSEAIKTPSREGAYLARVAAYIQECLNRHLPACDALPSWYSGSILQKAIEAGGGQHDEGIVNKAMTGVVKQMPHASVAPMLPAALLVCPTRAKLGCQPFNKPKPPSLSLVKDSYREVSEITRAVLMPCSLQVKQLIVSLVPISPASPNNEDQSIASFKTVNDNTYEAEIEACHHTKNVVSKGDETDRTHSFEVECEGAGSPYTYAGAVIHRPAPNNTTGLPKAKAWGGNQELLMKMLEEEKKRPDQEAISKMEACACLHLPRPPAALVLLTPKPAGLPLAYIPRSSSGLESRL